MRGRLCVVALLAGCFDPRPATGIACSSTGECPGDLVCVSGTCERAGTVVADAAPDVAVDAPVVPMLVQQVTGSLDHAATLTASLPAAPVPGDVLVMIGANEHAPLTSVTGGAASWTRAAGSETNANIELWVAVADGSSAVTIDCLTGDAQPIWMSVSEWSGLPNSDVIDDATATDGTTSPAGTAGITTTGARDLLIAGVADLQPTDFGVPMPGTWQALTPIAATAIAQSAWYRLVEPGAYAPTVSETGAHWDAVLAGLHTR